jgi:hypothetical protein
MVTDPESVTRHLAGIGEVAALFQSHHTGDRHPKIGGATPPASEVRGNVGLGGWYKP